MLDCAHEDIQIKRRLVEQMDKMDKQYAENLAVYTEVYTVMFWKGLDLVRVFILYTFSTVFTF